MLRYMSSCMHLLYCYNILVTHMVSVSDWFLSPHIYIKKNPRDSTRCMDVVFFYVCYNFEHVCVFCAASIVLFLWLNDVYTPRF